MSEIIKRSVTVPIHNHMKTYPGKTVRKRRGGQQRTAGGQAEDTGLATRPGHLSPGTEFRGTASQCGQLFFS